MNQHTIKPFREHGNYLQAHNALFDEIMPRVKPTSWKVLCLILRRTKGWNVATARLSFKDLMEGTGISGGATIALATEELLSLGCIVKIKKTGANGVHEVNEYGLNLDFKIIQKGIAENEQWGIAENEQRPPETEQRIAENEVVGIAENEQGGIAENEVYNKDIVPKTNKDNDGVKTANGSPPSNPNAKFINITPEREAMLKGVLIILERSVSWDMKTVAQRDERTIGKLMTKLEADGRTLIDLETYKQNFPKYLNRPPGEINPPTPDQMLSNFDTVLNFKRQENDAKPKLPIRAAHNDASLKRYKERLQAKHATK